MGVSERKEREKEQRRNSIIDAAEKVFFSKGIENATMDQVADTAEYSKGTIYLYFKNKNELLHAIIERGLTILFDTFKEAAESVEKGIEKISAIGQAYFEFYKKYPNHFTTMLHQDVNPLEPETLEKNPYAARCLQLGNDIFALLQEVAAIGISDGSVREDLDPAKLSLVLWGHSAGIMHIFKAKEAVIENLFGSSLEELVDYSHRLIGEYLAPPAAKGE